MTHQQNRHHQTVRKSEPQARESRSYTRVAIRLPSTFSPPGCVDGVQAFEPGRRTAILGPNAVAPLFRYLGGQFEAAAADSGGTGFSKRTGPGSMLGQRVFDERIQMSSDPNDPDGGFANWFGFLGRSFATRKMRWIENGVLKNLVYDPEYGQARGKQYAALPISLRVGGGTTTLDEMIAKCTEGIYVNRFSSVDMLDQQTGLLTGVTRDGCFLVRHRKIDRPVKNFRFIESPFFCLNKLVAVGPTARAAFGYTPSGRTELDIS